MEDDRYNRWITGLNSLKAKYPDEIEEIDAIGLKEHNGIIKLITPYKLSDKLNSELIRLFKKVYQS